MSPVTVIIALMTLLAKTMQTAHAKIVLEPVFEAELRGLGCGIQLIPDGDVAGVIATMTASFAATPSRGARRARRGRHSRHRTCRIVHGLHRRPAGRGTRRTR